MGPQNEENRSSGTGEAPPVDQTFIEGSGPKIAASPLTGGIRLDVTSLRASNPYGQQGVQDITDRNMLPAGNEKMPLGSGTIQGLLGTGGMARVYKIWNDELEVFRAVKILLPTQQKELRNRFETEAKITAKLHHPNIVEIYNVGDWNGLPYLEMEYVDGDPLEAIISKRGKLSNEVCCAAAIFVARALVYAHGQEFLIYGKNYHGVIHRDLKPANIMISKAGNVKLMDFGIARPTETSLHTVEGNIVGTMQYLSPEQIDGIDIDCRSDLYSFGAIVYEMLTGTKTFPQETITNLIKKKIVNEYRKFSDFDFAVSPLLAKITQKCLQADKANRYVSAKELLNELEAALKTMSLDDPAEMLQGYLGDPANYIVPAERKTIRITTPIVKKLMFPMVAALIFLAVVGGFVVTMMTREAKPRQGIAAQPVEPVMPAPPPQPAKPTVSIDESELKPLAGGPSASATPQSKPVPAPSGAQKQPPATAPGHLVSTGRSAISMDMLSKKYGTIEPLAIGRERARCRGDMTEAIFALEVLPDNDADGEQEDLLLLEAYIGARPHQRRRCSSRQARTYRMRTSIFSAETYRSLGKNQQALECFDNALTKPSTVRSHSEIRNDALYYGSSCVAICIAKSKRR